MGKTNWGGMDTGGAGGYRTGCSGSGRASKECHRRNKKRKAWVETEKNSDFSYLGTDILTYFLTY